MGYFREKWPGETITPNIHILEDHAVPFLKSWKTGCGVYGEQGGESIHHHFNTMARNYNGIKSTVDRARYMMEAHMLKLCPQSKSIEPICSKRKIKGT